ncbi:MAG: biosynthetic peptidoglycan transglycosylase [Steroidobacteraceae bacterium]
MSGTASSMEITRFARLAVWCAAGLVGLLALIVVVIVAWPARVPSFASARAGYVPSDAWLLDRHGVVLASRRIRYDVRRLPWVPLDGVSPALVTAIVNGEDRRFWKHHGVDWRAVAGAARDELVHHHRRGASTLTMQLATLLRDHPHARDESLWREVPRKIEQIRTALALERTWTKPEILEAYLNLLGYRGELQGIGAAAAELAGKTPSGLSVPESVLLAALLPQARRESCARHRPCLRARAHASSHRRLRFGPLNGTNRP